MGKIQGPPQDKKTKTRDKQVLDDVHIYPAKDVFGDRFVIKKETSKSGKKCHNYFTNKWVVEIAIELMNWNLRNLDYIAPEIVQTYDLERRKENDPCSRLSTGEV